MNNALHLTIRAIHVRGLDLQLARPVETASGVLSTAPLALIDLVTGEGITGSSYIRCYTPLALQPLVQLVANCGELLIGQVAAPATIEQKLQQHFRLLGTQGLLGMALAGIDMALWDARAKACGLPLVILLGGELKPIPAYGSLKRMSPEGAASEAEEMLALGFTAFKVKLGRGDLAADLATIRAVRRAIGDDKQLMVDYNQSLSVPEATRRVRVLDEEGLFWIEEPTRADDFEGHARLAGAASTVIQLGENWWGPHDMARSIAAHASDHVMLDVMKIGGVSGFFLPHLVGIGKALELAMLADEVSGPEAERLGLANKCVPPAEFEETVRTFAARLAQGPTSTYGLIKELITTAVASDLETTMRIEGELQDIAITTADHREGVAAFLQKRSAAFTGR